MNDLTELLAECADIAQQASKAYEQECDAWWSTLSKEQQLQAFYSVVKRIYQGEIVDQGSYRHVLYDVFGFGPEAYGVGMDCGYLSLHNAIEVDK